MAPRFSYFSYAFFKKTQCGAGCQDMLAQYSLKTGCKHGTEHYDFMKSVLESYFLGWFGSTVMGLH